MFLGYVSFKNRTGGSWFIQSLCDVLEETGDSIDILSNLTTVCHKVATEYESDIPETEEIDHKKQIPCITSSLTKKMYFKKSSQNSP